MKICNLRCFHVLALFLLSTSTAVLAGEDLPGSQDYPDFPRVKDTYIAGYGFGEYDAGVFVTGKDDKTKAETLMPEGARTRILYIGTPTQTSLQLLRNYQKAFAEYGEYQELYTCRGEDCPRNITKELWSEENRVPTSLRNASRLYSLTSQYKQVNYAYGTIKKEDRVLHVSAMSAVIVAGMTGLRNVPVVHLEVLEAEAFSADLEFVDAGKMLSSITETGSVALYGIQFEFDSAALKSASAATIEEIAKVLASSPELNVYVVGHTDGEGSLAYNQQLSSQRAATVVDALQGSHGVAAGRLTAVGIGPVAPLATNATEAGRKLNRRVEIVAR